jgi:hypothetical protein
MLGIVRTTKQTTQNERQIMIARYTSQASLFGIPLIAIASGPDTTRGERFGHARGIIALGDVATGVVACGAVARGVVAVGGVSLGVISSSGGLAVGAVACGGLAFGGLAVGGLAVGVMAVGGLAIGIVKAVGGFSILLKHLL